MRYTGIYFKIARIKAGYKAIIVARKIGVTPTVLSLIENGHKSVESMFTVD